MIIISNYRGQQIFVLAQKNNYLRVVRRFLFSVVEKDERERANNNKIAFMKSFLIRKIINRCS